MLQPLGMADGSRHVPLLPSELVLSDVHLEQQLACYGGLLRSTFSFDCPWSTPAQPSGQGEPGAYGIFTTDATAGAGHAVRANISSRLQQRPLAGAACCPSSPPPAAALPPTSDPERDQDGDLILERRPAIGRHTTSRQVAEQGAQSLSVQLVQQQQPPAGHDEVNNYQADSLASRVMTAVQAASAQGGAVQDAPIRVVPVQALDPLALLAQATAAEPAAAQAAATAEPVAAEAEAEAEAATAGAAAAAGVPVSAPAPAEPCTVHVLDIVHHGATPLGDVGLQVWRGECLLADLILHLLCTGALPGPSCTLLELGGGVGVASAALASAVSCPTGECCEQPQRLGLQEQEQRQQQQQQGQLQSGQQGQQGRQGQHGQRGQQGAQGQHQRQGQQQGQGQHQRGKQGQHEQHGQQARCHQQQCWVQGSSDTVGVPQPTAPALCVYCTDAHLPSLRLAYANCCSALGCRTGVSNGAPEQEVLSVPPLTAQQQAGSDAAGQLLGTAAAGMAMAAGGVAMGPAASVADTAIAAVAAAAATGAAAARAMVSSAAAEVQLRHLDWMDFAAFRGGSEDARAAVRSLLSNDPPGASDSDASLEARAMQIDAEAGAGTGAGATDTAGSSSGAVGQKGSSTSADGAAFAWGELDLQRLATLDILLAVGAAPGAAAFRNPRT